MPDISMCMGGDCPLKETCYRFTAKPKEYMQPYFFEPPYDEKEGACNYYWEIKDKNK